MKQLLSILLGLLLSFSLYAQSGKSATEEVKITTSAQCDMCKDRIEKAMSFEKGVKSATLDVTSKILTVVYKKGKTDAAKIKTAVAKVGYDADEVKADPEAYKKLPGCCQKGGH